MKSSFKKILFKGTAKVLTIYVSGILLSYLTTVLLTRTLTIEQYGIFALGLAWLSLLQIVGSCGFDITSVRFVSNFLPKGDVASLHSFISYAFKTSSIVSFLLATFFALVSYLLFATNYIEKTTLLVLLGISLCIPLRAYALILAGILRGGHFIATSRIGNDIILNLFFGILILLVSAHGVKAWIAPTALILYIISASLVLIYYFTLVMNNFSFKHHCDPLSRATDHQWLATSLRILGLTLVYLTLKHVDLIMVGLFRPASEVAIYSIAIKLSAVSLLGWEAVSYIAGPIIAEAYATNTEKLRNIYRSITIWSRIVVLPIAVSVLILCPWILPIFGQDYLSAITPFSILLLSALPPLVFGPIGHLYSMTGKEKYAIRSLLVALVMNLVGNIPAVIYFGLNGVAMVTVLSTFLRDFILWKNTKTVLPFLFKS